MTYCLRQPSNTSTIKIMRRQEEILSGIANRSRMKSLRSLALYRLANMIKEEKQNKHWYSEKIETKSMNGPKAILKAQIYENMGKKSNALIELNSPLLSSNSARTELDQNNLLLLEITNHHRQRLQQSK